MLLVLGVALLPACLPVSKTPYTQKKYYHKTKAAIAGLPNPQNQPDTVQVGWAKVNITPRHQAPLAGYGKRKGKRLTGIHDSIWVRAFVFKNKRQRVAFVTMDLLIAPMSVREALVKALPNIGYQKEQVYLTASHAHSSLGGWAKRPAGFLMAGKYEPKIVAGLTQAILQAIKTAEQRAVPAQIGYAALIADSLVANRLVGAGGSRDTALRIVKIRKNTSETAVLVTYAAHATCLPAAELHISGDYPTALVKLLEQEPGINFAAFGAGGVASHSPAASGSGYEKVNNMAQGLATIIQREYREIPLRYQSTLNAVEVPLYLRKPHWRFAENWRFHPAMFYLVFGKYPATLSGLRIGDIVFIGTPCDFSGELVLDLQPSLTSNQAKLVVTSFNGGYIGYITPDKYYNLKKYETRDMNFFGPGNGAYLSEMVRLLWSKL
ncbi:neutral/alkaline non-lysosomal ceramidase N-terminal domain-containing protein [Adhaeribacter aerolatus]|uniref:neutral/alkaline non-lysosomal ceramidase N-terminal domain-containing protein n=1 Tax=Adhaeribacter aerolatus TaxID=670289 RepID=UPI001479664B|nr:neutral/alkaline non-lysosomal ceramidase N-terminal domain-containing protein [Adhaeribacter aerolatus]